jgi:hypothetical protein
LTVLIEHMPRTLRTIRSCQDALTLIIRAEHPYLDDSTDLRCRIVVRYDVSEVRAAMAQYIKPAHSAVLTLNSIRWVSVYVEHFRSIIYYIRPGELFEHQRSESRSDIRWYSAVHTIPIMTHQCHVVCCQITGIQCIRVKWFLHIILDYPFDSINRAHNRYIKYDNIMSRCLDN